MSADKTADVCYSSKETGEIRNVDEQNKRDVYYGVKKRADISLTVERREEIPVSQ